MQGLVVNALRSSGIRGAGLASIQTKASLGSGGALEALIRNLENVGLRIRAGDGEKEREGPAAGELSDETTRGDMNRRGIVFSEELRERGFHST